MLPLGLFFFLQGPTFMQATTYQACQKTTEFACAFGDRHYGTAREVEMCERYEFHPDGTYTSSGLLLQQDGTYFIFAGKVTLTDDERTFELALSPDGTTLGNLHEITTRAHAPG